MNCGKTFVRGKKQKYCSYKCGGEHLSRSGKIGWQSRAKKSYAEKFWEQVLKNNKIAFEYDKRVGRFYIDFAIEIDDKKIALEIDGKQHEYPERKKSDAIKDKYLKRNNWLVYRIPWNEINTDHGKEEMLEKINCFLTYIGA